jgi:hypothetical protein
VFIKLKDRNQKILFCLLERLKIITDTTVTRQRWEDIIKMDLQEVGWGTWTGLTWLRRGTCGRHFYMG